MRIQPPSVFSAGITESPYVYRVGLKPSGPSNEVIASSPFVLHYQSRERKFVFVSQPLHLLFTANTPQAEKASNSSSQGDN